MKKLILIILKNTKYIIFSIFLTLINTTKLEGQGTENPIDITIGLANNQYGSITRLPFRDILDFSAPSLSIEAKLLSHWHMDFRGRLVTGKIVDSRGRRSKHFAISLNPTIIPQWAKFSLSPSIQTQLFLGGELGLINFRGSRLVQEDQTNGFWSFPIGLDLNYSDQISMRFSTTYVVGFDRNINFRSYTIGVNLRLSKPSRYRDHDGDGIPDKEDCCPKVKGKEIYQGCPNARSCKRIR